MDTIQVHQTKDYGLFKTVEGNRQLNELHIKRLMQSMSQQYLVSPIIVNEHHQIIDGQHRFNAAKEMDLPVYYIQIEGYGLPEVQRLNQHSKNWSQQDFLIGYADMGIESYVAFRRFFEENSLPITTALAVANGYPDGKIVTEFKEGKWVFEDYLEAEHRMAKINALKEYTEIWNQRSFVYAMLSLFKNPIFEFSQFLQKLSYQPMALVKCATVSQYITLIEEIYNYRSRNKVSLRY